MGKCNRSDYNHVLYNQNRARAKSGDKIKNLVDRIIKLKKRESLEGMTKRLQNEYVKAYAMMKKYQITDGMIAEKIQSKGLTHLIK